MEHRADGTSPDYRVVIVDKYASAAGALQAVLNGAVGFLVVGVFHEATEATAEAVALLAPAMVLVDVTTNGAGFIRRLRRHTPAARIVAMTTRPTVDGEAAALRAGADAYLEKSPERGHFVRQLTAIGTQSRVAASPK